MENIKEAVSLANRAIEFDQKGCLDAAAYYYHQAAKLLEQICSGYDCEERETWLMKAEEYNKRADNIQRPTLQRQESQDPTVSLLNRCKFLLSQALDADEAGQKETAIRLYTEAVEFSLNAQTETDNSEQQGLLKKYALQALERAEELKGIQLEPVKEVTQVVPTKGIVPRATTSRQASSQKPSLHRGSSAHLKVSGDVMYTDEEKKVLLATSKINKIEYVPFMAIDLSERFQYVIPFSDKDGILALSPKQKQHFSRWARPEEFCSEPKLIQTDTIDCYSIKQTIVSDCSFVASLAVSALYEKKFKTRLITSIIYPCNRNKEPIFNPFGKYMVKLHLNGVPRKVTIDDLLPLGRHGELLCSFSTNKSEFWISLLEKAYMKVMGGYDFPGSNSNIDLHALTGWIPERVAIRLNDPDFNAEGVFKMLLDRMAKGHVLATVATGEMPESYAERAGLVPTHAYALLEVRYVNEIKLLQLKNPWSHVRWKGNYSEIDTRHWTPELQRELNFDPSSAAQFDNGVFWIDYNSILNYFDVFYLSWNPKIFSYTDCIHQSWSAGLGPARDRYNIGDNPQFKLSVSETTGSVWILLTRHIKDIEDFKQNREYITVLVYKNKGKRVYYPNDPPPYLDGIRINSPHYLTKIVMKDTTERDFTLVVSQYEKMNTIYYTLRAYATCPINMEKIINPYVFVKEMTGEWKGVTAGGCRNHPLTYHNNPCYLLKLESRSSLLIDLKAPKEFNIALEILNHESPEREIKSTGAYRSGFVIMEIEDIYGGSYDIVPSTFLPNQESAFFVTFKSTSRIQVQRTR